MAVSPGVETFDKAVILNRGGETPSNDGKTELTAVGMAAEHEVPGLFGEQILGVGIVGEDDSTVGGGKQASPGGINRFAPKIMNSGEQ